MANPFDIIQVTAQYSNAVLLAILPHVSDFAKKLELPIPIPITTNDVERFSPAVVPVEVGGGMTLRSGYKFDFFFGFVRGFSSPESFYETERIYGLTRKSPTITRTMSTNDAIGIARDVIRRLGYTEKDLFMDFPPRIQLFGVPPRATHFEITWPNPRDDADNVVIEINIQSRKPSTMWLLNERLFRPPPKIDVDPIVVESQPLPKQEFPPSFPPERARAEMIKNLPRFEKFIRTLDLPIVTPLTTNQIEKYESWEEFGRIVTFIQITNGYRVFCDQASVNTFRAPDMFYGENNLNVREFVGKAKLTENQVIALGRATARKLGLLAEHFSLSSSPQIEKPKPETNIPRYFLTWRTIDDAFNLKTSIEMEIDAGTGSIKFFEVKDRTGVRPGL